MGLFIFVSSSVQKLEPNKLDFLGINKKLSFLALAFEQS
jgi:hypothetical protein